MKRNFIKICILLTLCGFLFLLWISLDAEWSGVDKSVIEKFAKEAGKTPSKSIVNTESGDLLLFFFLTAGAIGGFVGGLCFSRLFPNERKHSRGQSDV